MNRNEASNMSAIEPKQYQERFVKFIESQVFKRQEISLLTEKNKQLFINTLV